MKDSYEDIVQVRKVRFYEHVDLKAKLPELVVLKGK